MTKDRPIVPRSHPRKTARTRTPEPDVAAPEPSAPSPLPSPNRPSERPPSPSMNGKAPVSHSSVASSTPLPDQDHLGIDEVGTHWVRLQWSITPKTQERAFSAMGREGHRSTRVLRVLRIKQDDSGPRSKELMEEIVLPPAATEWFLHLPSREYAWIIEIGTIFGENRFFSMIHSAPVILNGTRTPLPGTDTWLNKERFLETLDGSDPPPLKVQGKFVLSGSTRPGAQATIDDQLVPVSPHTGEFQWELPLANGRIVIPMDVQDCGKIQRALLALDLNFHLLEPEPGPEY